MEENNKWGQKETSESILLKAILVSTVIGIVTLTLILVLGF